MCSKVDCCGQFNPIKTSCGEVVVQEVHLDSWHRLGRSTEWHVGADAKLLVTCLVWGEPELAHEYDLDVENIIVKNRKFEVCNFLVFCSLDNLVN